MSYFEHMASQGGDKILLIGDAGKAFIARDATGNEAVELCADADAALSEAENFRYIGLLMVSVRNRLGVFLRALRAKSPSAKIILFAQMTEEPLAIDCVNTAVNGSMLADDYLICPVRMNEFVEAFFPGPEPEKKTGSPKPSADPSIENKIRELEILATTDDLTGLRNRRYVMEFCRQIIEYAGHIDGRVTVLMFDIDYFKHYNDVYSHWAGDEILKQVAILMRRCCRAHDVVGRIGGDEFMVIFWDIPGGKTGTSQDERRGAMSDHPKEAIFIAKRFRSELKKAQLNLLGEKQGVLTISGGLASFPRDGSSAEELVAQADKALMDAKRSGKDRIYLFGSPQDDIENVE
jgi:diguanylate cyclase (GGDEF)-like protein